MPLIDGQVKFIDKITKERYSQSDVAFIYAHPEVLALFAKQNPVQQPLVESVQFHLKEKIYRCVFQTLMASESIGKERLLTFKAS